MATTHFSEIHSGPGNKFSFEIADLDLSIINALRRVILAEVPNVAFAFDPYDESNNDIVFLNNTSSLHNEFMGHRISLLPVNFTLGEISKWDPTSFSFRIKQKNESNETLVLTSKHIEIFDSSGELVPDSLRERLFPADPTTGDYILISKLKPNPFKSSEGEVLECEMRARKGCAMQHARWSHVSLCSFINKIDTKAADVASKELLKNIDPSITEEEKNRIINKFNTIERQRIFHKNQYGEPSHFIFSIECINSMVVPYELVSTAFQILIDKIKMLTDPEKTQIHCLNDTDHMFLIKIKDEGHTIGNMLQSLIYNMYARDKETIRYVGYYQPHPLENDVVLKMRHDGLASAESMSDFLKEVSGKIAADLMSLKEEWLQMNGTTKLNVFKPNRKKIK